MGMGLYIHEQHTKGMATSKQHTTALTLSPVVLERSWWRGQGVGGCGGRDGGLVVVALDLVGDAAWRAALLIEGVE